MPSFLQNSFSHLRKKGIPDFIIAKLPCRINRKIPKIPRLQAEAVGECLPLPSKPQKTSSDPPAAPRTTPCFPSVRQHEPSDPLQNLSLPSFRLFRKDFPFPAGFDVFFVRNALFYPTKTACPVPQLGRRIPMPVTFSAQADLLVAYLSGFHPGSRGRNGRKHPPQGADP